MGVENGEQVESNLIFQGVVPQYRLEDLPEDELQGGPAPWYTKSNQPLTKDFRHGCPPLVIGGSALGKGIFTDDDVLQSSEPYRVIRLAFQYGIRAIDTSPFYHPSEISLGRILKTLSKEFPRNTYYLQTKVGRYGQKRKDFDYSPNQIRESVKTSLKRLHTDYLDSVVLHDVEFVCDEVGPSQKAGTSALDALSNKAVQKQCGISIGDQANEDAELIPAKKYGKGDEIIVAAAQTLFELKEQGVIRNVGIGGYPLPTLLRLSRLIACHPPFLAVDIIVNYSHHTLQNDLLSQYSVEFSREPRAARQKAANSKIPDWVAPTIINASPFSMGLLTDQGPPPWHPASEELKEVCIKASNELQNIGQSLAQTAAQFGFRGSELKKSNLSSSPSLTLKRAPFIPTIVGMNNIEQVHQAIQMFRAVSASTHFSEDDRRQVAYPMSTKEAEKYRSYIDQQKENEKYVIDLLESKSLRNWTWASPP